MKTDIPVILVKEKNGCVVPLRQSSILPRLENAFDGAGWEEERGLAREILLALELALFRKEPDGGTITVGAADLSVVRCLEGSGLGMVAREYQSHTGRENITVSVTAAGLKQLLSGHLAVGETELGQVIDRVLSALRVLQLDTAEPELIWELARHYAGQLTTGDDEPVTIPVSDKSAIPELDFQSLLSGEAAQLFRHGGLHYGGCSRFFPGIRIDWDLPAMGRYFRLQYPVLELELRGVLNYYAGILGKLRDNLRAGFKRTDFQLQLHIHGETEFLTEWMGIAADSPEGTRILSEMQIDNWL